MLLPRVLYLLSLVVYTFGALAFAALALGYARWRFEGRARRGPVLGVFTAVCALAFSLNVLLQAWPGPTSWIPTVTLLQGLATGLIPVLLLHLVLADEWPGRRSWLVFVAPLYPLTAANLLASWAPLDAAILVFSALAALVAILLTPRAAEASTRRQRLLRGVLLLLLAASSPAGFFLQAPLLSVLPDYLILAFLAVTLYYNERLAFFDVLVKRGALAAAGLLALAAADLALEPWLNTWTEPWSHPWLLALLLTPLWLLAPPLDRALSRLIDRAWLGRKLDAGAAERLFVESIQAAASPEELRAAAAAQLTSLFQAPARVAAAPAEAAVCQPYPPEGEPLGYLLMDQRPDGIPFLSGDLSLLRTLARTLAVAEQSAAARQRLRQQQGREEQLRLLASRAELKALRAQINPHFLFNALNSIAGLIRVRPELADETLEHLAQVFRYTLRKSEAEWSRLEEEIEFIDAYLRVEQARFGDRLTVEFDCGAVPGAHPVPALSLQPLVENAMKHGIAAVEGPGVVRIRAAIEGDRLRLSVFNTGPALKLNAASLFDSSPSESHGLRNVARRLQGYYEGAAALEWSNVGDGVLVSISLPLAPQKEFLR